MKKRLLKKSMKKMTDSELCQCVAYADGKMLGLAESELDRRLRGKGSKIHNCDACMVAVEVQESYQPEYCCDGRECGCYGESINPVLCTKCEKRMSESLNKPTTFTLF